MAYLCEECNHPSDTRHGMAMHLLNSSNHPDTESFGAAEELAGDMKEVTGEDTENGTEPETVSSDGGVVPSDHRHSEPSDTSGADCCSSPDLQGSAGEVYQLDSGQYVKLESGDKICVNCDEIHD